MYASTIRMNGSMVMSCQFGVVCPQEPAGPAIVGTMIRVNDRLNFVGGNRLDCSIQHRIDQVGICAYVAVVKLTSRPSKQSIAGETHLS